MLSPFLVQSFFIEPSINGGSLERQQQFSLLG